MTMPYRRMGNTGLKLSLLSFGSWVTFGTQVDTSLAVDCLAAAHEGGVNFFDNAEAYGGGKSETIMGAALAELGWARSSYVVSTKLFWGLSDDVNMSNTLNRKYLMQAIDGSLERFGLDFVDLVYCHRPDSQTPIGETVWAMSDMISAGKAHYWGTSEWSGAEIAEAAAFAERHNLHAPVVEQPQYNLFERRRVEHEYARLYDSTAGLGLTTWSPLASGLLTGKYLDGVPEGSRGSLPGYEWLRNLLTEPGPQRHRARPGGHRGAHRRDPRAAGHRLVRREPPRHVRDPGREQRRPGHREPRRPHRPRAAHRRGARRDRAALPALRRSVPAVRRE